MLAKFQDQVSRGDNEYGCLWLNLRSSWNSSNYNEALVFTFLEDDQFCTNFDFLQHLPY